MSRILPIPTHRDSKLKIVGNIKSAIMHKRNKRLTPIETAMQDETLRSKFPTQADLDAAFEGAHRFREACDRERKLRCREDGRERVVNWIGGIVIFVGVNGLFIFLLQRTRIYELLSDKLGSTLSVWIIVILWFGFAFLCATVFFWLLDKTGVHYLIEDWVISWEMRDRFHVYDIQKYKNFPRTKRRELIRNLERELDAVTDQLSRLDEEDEDYELSESRESFWQIIGDLITEVEGSSRCLISQPEGASWVGVVLALRRTFDELESASKEIEKYDEKVQPLIREALQIVTSFRTRIEQAL